MNKATNKTAVKKAVRKPITIWKVSGYEGRLEHYFGHKKEAERFVKTHDLKEATIAPFLSEY